MKAWLRKHWRLLLIIIVGVPAFLAYAWFPKATSGESFGEYVEKAVPGEMASYGDVLGEDSEFELTPSNSPLFQWGGLEKFNSPDETANYFFTFRQAQGKPLFYEEPQERVGNNLIRPRSVNVVDQRVAPGSFYGMYFIYGGLGRLLGPGMITYLTPLFAVIGVIFFYLLIARVFNRNVALISALLAYVMPAWMYFANQSMYHNVLFVALFIIGIHLLLRALDFKSGKLEIRNKKLENKIPNYSLVKNYGLTGFSLLHNGLKPVIPQQRGASSPETNYWLLVTNYLLYALAGLFIGGALITRMSELGWVALAVLLLLIFNFKKINWAGFLLFIAFLLITFIPVFTVNHEIYGQPLSIGYRPDVTGELSQLIRRPGLLYELLVSPFGFAPRIIAENAWHYLGRFFWYFSVPAVAGFLVWLFRQLWQKRVQYKPTSTAEALRESASLADAQTGADLTQTDADKTSPNPSLARRGGAQWAFLVIWLVISIYLLVYYGSWQISDRIDEGTVSIGTSFIRYWLPIYLGMLPFISFLACWLISLIRKMNWAKPVVVVLLLILIAVPGARIVFTDSDESLLQLRDNIREQQVKSLVLTKLLNENEIVILGFKQADKIFFPQHRRIITELAVPFDYESVARLAKLASLKYYHFAPAGTIAFISRRDFEPRGLRIDVGSGQKVFRDEVIYDIVKIDKSN